ncbi:uncharacterized protein METZ01_LOCUS247456, partial [marine metagenome]
VDGPTLEYGGMFVLPGWYLEGSFELKGCKAWEYQESCIPGLKPKAIYCVAGIGSVTSYYPALLHSSRIRRSPEGTHRRAAAHRMRARRVQISDWR